ncbi:MAG: mechanosensitive ion channel family protein [Bacteroidota bacterium]
MPQTVAPADTAATRADSARAAADTLRADSAAVDSVAADTTDPLTRVSQEFSEATDLLLAGELGLFWEQFSAGLGDLVIGFIPLLLKALLVFFLLYGVYRAFGSVLRRVMDRSSQVDAGLQGIITKTYRFTGLSLIVIMVLSQFGVNVAALLAGFSIVGIAVGFAARDTLENFISGVTILLDRPFRIGDNVTVAEVYGTVEDITLRSTRLRTLTNEMMIMPNLQMVNQKLINHSMLGLKRVDVPFGIAYKEYPDEARRVVLELTEGDPRLHPDFPPNVVVTALNDSSVDLVLRLFITNPKQEVAVRFEYVEKVREALREADIEIPFPHMQLFLDEAKGLEGSTLFGKRDPGPAQDTDTPE